MAGVQRVPSQFIFATEALRDAAIPAPVEGQRAYVTASTVAAATGAITAVPSGVQTIYNGSAWVCVTPVGAKSANWTPGTEPGTTSTSFVTTLSGDATAISVTVTTGTTALVQCGYVARNSADGMTTFVSVSVSGATTIAATTDGALAGSVAGANKILTSGLTYVQTGLTAGTNTFTMNYTGDAGTKGFINRSLVVRGIA
jgi:hypothetical protein